jgi:hypothetical protein
MGCKTAPEIFIKAPEEEVIKAFEYEGDDLATGEVVQSVDEVTIEPTGDPDDLEYASPVPNGTQVVLTFTGGRAGIMYVVKCRVVTSLGQTLVVAGRMRVEEI